MKHLAPRNCFGATVVLKWHHSVDTWKVFETYVTGTAKPTLFCTLPNTSVLQAGNKSIQKRQQEIVATSI